MGVTIQNGAHRACCFAAAKLHKTAGTCVASPGSEKLPMGKVTVHKVAEFAVTHMGTGTQPAPQGASFTRSDSEQELRQLCDIRCQSPCAPFGIAAFIF